MRISTFLVFVFLTSASVVKAQQDSVSNVTQLANLSLEELMNIKVVTASGYLQTMSEAPSTITVITARQIAERGYEQLEDALRDVPGIDMIHINGYAPTLIYFRGMYGAENLRALLMIDGIAENNILGSNDFAGPAYSLHNVDRIEIIWGPVSALYGANAFGGVINIITKKGADINGLHAEQGFGSFNTSFGKVSLGIRKSNFEFAAAGTVYSTDGPKFNNRDPQYSGAYVDKAWSFNGTISHYGKKSVTTLGYRSYRTPMGWGNYSNSPTAYLRLPPQGNGNSGILGVLQRNIRGEKSGLDDPFLRTGYLQQEWKPNKKLDLLGRLVYRETGIGDDSYIYITVTGTRLIRVPIASYSKRFSAEASANYTISKMQTISAGVQYFRDNVEQGSRQSTVDITTPYLIDGVDTVKNIHATFLPRKYDIRDNFGSFLQYVLNTKLLHKTSFTLGGRYDYNSYFGDALSPRLAIVNKPSKELTLKLQVGTAFRAPSNLEIHQTPPDSNFQLKKERIRTYELNAIYAFSGKAQLQVNAFRNELTDIIVLGNLSSPLTPDKNPGSITVNGIEAAADLSMAKNITGFANFTFQDAVYKNLVTKASGKVPGVATVKGNAGVTFRTADLFTVSISGNWVGQRLTPATDPYGPVHGYFLTNFVISTQKLFGNRVSASINVHNIFNVKWLDPGFRTADGFLYSTVMEQPGMNGLFKIGIDL